MTNACRGDTATSAGHCRLGDAREPCRRGDQMILGQLHRVMSIFSYLYRSIDVFYGAIPRDFSAAPAQPRPGPPKMPSGVRSKRQQSRPVTPLHRMNSTPPSAPRRPRRHGAIAPTVASLLIARRPIVYRLKRCYRLLSVWSLSTKFAPACGGDDTRSWRGPKPAHGALLRTARLGPPYCAGLSVSGRRLQ